MKTSKKLIAKKTRHRRIAARMHGTTTCPRLIVFRSNKRTYAQLIDDDARKTLVNASDIKNKTFAKKMESAKKIGLELAKKAKEKGIETCVFDRAGYRYHGRVKAVAEGAREGGLKF
ncbi:50S ribosomal protein L18 [Candidatus Peregrinibacteria bacterium]|nr:50S ribosomal protein L18 [Candidatus Peregrinibacteria bacterium]